MRQIHDQKCLNSYLERYEIPSLFDTKELSFRLYQYEAGEILDSRGNPTVEAEVTVEKEPDG